MSPKSQLFTNNVNKKLVFRIEYFLSKCDLIFLPAAQSKKINVAGISPAQIIGCQKSLPPIIASPKSNIGKSEITKTPNEKIVPNGSPMNNAVCEPILSRFIFVIVSVYRQAVCCAIVLF